MDKGPNGTIKKFPATKKQRFHDKGTTLFRGPRREKVAPTEQPKSGVEEARSQQPYPGNTLLTSGFHEHRQFFVDVLPQETNNCSVYGFKSAISPVAASIIMMPSRADSNNRR